MIKVVLIIGVLIFTSNAFINDGPFFCTVDDQSGASCTADLNDNKESIGFLGKGQFEIFDNTCIACKNSQARFVFELSACPNPSAKSADCLNVPVCGVVDAKTLHQFKNHCNACADGKIKQFFHGFCPFTHQPEGKKPLKNTGNKKVMNPHANDRPKANFKNNDKTAAAPVGATTGTALLAASGQH